MRPSLDNIPVPVWETEFCDHSPSDTLVWEGSRAFGFIKNYRRTAIPCRRNTRGNKDSCGCGCHYPGSDAWKVAHGEFPKGFDDPDAHAGIAYEVRKRQIALEKTVHKYECKNIAFGLTHIVERPMWGFVALQNKRAAEEIQYMMLEDQEEAADIWHNGLNGRDPAVVFNSWDSLQLIADRLGVERP